MIAERFSTGFLVTDGGDMGRAIELLRQYARMQRSTYIRDLAERLDAIPVACYHRRIMPDELAHAV